MAAAAAPAELVERWASNASTTTSSPTSLSPASSNPTLLRRLSSTRDSLSKGLRKLSRVLSGGSLDRKVRTGNKVQRACSSSPDGYEFIEVLGEGASATVVRARCLSTRKDVAIKQIELDALPVDWGTFVSEAQVMRGLKHKNLLPLLNTVLDGEYLWLITPYVKGGTLSDVLRHAYHSQGLPEPVLATVAAAVLRALAYLHVQGYVHRDVKASNVLLGSDGSVYLGDLGTAAQVITRDEQRPEVLLRLQRTTFIGTVPYMSPELVEGAGYGMATDVWSLGVMLVELATGRRPHRGRTTAEALYSVLNDEPTGLPDDGRFSPTMRDLVARCLVKDPSKRSSAEKLLSHPALKKVARDEAFLKSEVMPRLPPADVRARVYLATAEGGPGDLPVYGTTKAPLSPCAASAANVGLPLRGPLPPKPQPLASMRRSSTAGMRRFSTASMRSAGGSSDHLSSAHLDSAGSLHGDDVVPVQDDEDWDFSPAFAT